MAHPVAIIIGSFDGVHCGHRALIRATRTRVGDSGRIMAQVFDPHPRTIRNPRLAPPRLTTFSQRQRLLTEAGVDEIVRLEPTRNLLDLTPDAFLKQLTATHAPTAIVEGSDFRFGRDRTGTVETLRVFGRRAGVDIVVVPPAEEVLVDQSIVTVSSTLIRWLIERGRVDDAARLLGRPYELEGVVVRGQERGRVIGIPTANLGSSPCLLPADGVYAGSGLLPDGARVPAAISVGSNPTFDDERRRCEVHLIGFAGAIGEYGWPLTVTFHHWLREQVRFASVAPLVEQITRDIQRTLQIVAVEPVAA